MFGGASSAAAAAASRAMADSAAGSLHAVDVAEPKRETSPEAKAKSSDDSEVCCTLYHVLSSSDHLSESALSGDDIRLGVSMQRGSSASKGVSATTDQWRRRSHTG